MKKNRTLLGVALVIALLVLGVGYALSATNLNVKGTASIKASDTNFKVAFAEVATDGSDITSKGTGTSADTITKTSDTQMTLGVNSLQAVGDEVTFEMTIKNTSATGIYASIPAPTITVGTNGSLDNSKYYTVTTSWTATEELAPVDGSKTFTVTVKLDKAPVADITEEFTVAFEATPINK